MKKIIMMALLGTAISISAAGQKLDAAKVPAAVKTAFATRYPGMAAKWEKEDGKYEASFTRDDKKMSAMFTPNGSFAEAEEGIKFVELPVSVKPYIQDHYKGTTPKGASRITKADGTVNYEVSINGKDLIFDAGGKFIREDKD